MSADEAKKYKDLGNEAFKQKNFKEAIQNFTKAIEINPNDHVFYSNRSAAYASLEEYDQALDDATKCVEMKPDWAKGYTRKGLAEFYLYDYVEAEKTYKKGLEIEPENAQLKEGLQRVLDSKKQSSGFGGAGAGAGPGGAGGAGGQNAFYQQMLTKLISDPETASYLQDPEFINKMTALQKNPQLLNQYMSDPKIAKAFEVISKGFDPSKMQGANFNAGGADFNPGAGSSEPEQKEEPKPTFEEKKPEPPKQDKKPKEVSPADEEKNKGNEAYKKKNFEVAIQHYDKAIELNPQEPIYYSNKAAVYIEMKQADKAIEVCDKAIEVCKAGGHYDYVKMGKVLARKASCYVQLEQYDQALEYLSQSLLENSDQKVKDEVKRIEKIKKEVEAKKLIDPEKAEEFRLRGNELYGQGKYPDAIKEYEEALKRNPQDAKLYANKATALMKLMEYPTALIDINKCIDLDPTYVKAYAKKGVIQHMMKEYHKALDTFDKGLKIDPNNEELKKGKEKTQLAVMGVGGSESKEDAEERYRHAMADPDIQAILIDPNVRQFLKDLQENPTDPKTMEVMKDPGMAGKINKLVAAGILKMG